MAMWYGGNLDRNISISKLTFILGDGDVTLPFVTRLDRVHAVAHGYSNVYGLWNWFEANALSFGLNGYWSC